jgi:osmotically inducible protein OsmC
MALAAQLSGAGLKPDSIKSHAKVHFGQVDGGWAIQRIELITEASVPGATAEQFEAQAQAAKKGCPVSKALTGVEITLDARLV